MNSPGAVVSLVTICQVVKIPLIAAKANAGSFIVSLIANTNSHLTHSASQSKSLSMYLHTLSSQAPYLPWAIFSEREKSDREGGRRGSVTQWVQRAKEVPVELKE